MTRNSNYQRHSRGYHSHPANLIPSSNIAEFNKNRKRRKYTLTLRHLISDLPSRTNILGPLALQVACPELSQRIFCLPECTKAAYFRLLRAKYKLFLVRVDAAAKLQGQEAFRKPLALVSSEKWTFQHCFPWWGSPHNSSGEQDCPK